MHATIGWKLLRDLLSTSLIPAEGKSERKQYQQVSNGQKIRKQSASVNHGIGNLKGSNQNQPIRQQLICARESVGANEIR